MNLLRVDMSMKRIPTEKSKEEYRLLGNRGLIGRLAYDELYPQCDPLGLQNKLIIATSPLGGLGITCAGRLSIGGKSPLTEGIKEANSGGVAATKLVKQGIKAIIVEGLPENGEMYDLLKEEIDKSDEGKTFCRDFPLSGHAA